MSSRLYVRGVACLGTPSGELLRMLEHFVPKIKTLALISSSVPLYTGKMRQIRTPPEFAPRLDRAFIYAFDHFIRIRGWTIQTFAQLSQKWDNSIHPHQVTKWRAGRVYPSIESVINACRTFGVPRSFFYYVGEQLVALEDLGKDPTKSGLRVLTEALPDLEDPSDLELIRDLETYVAEQKSRLTRLVADRNAERERETLHG